MRKSRCLDESDAASDLVRPGQTQRRCFQVSFILGGKSASRRSAPAGEEALLVVQTQDRGRRGRGSPEGIVGWDIRRRRSLTGRGGPRSLRGGYRTPSTTTKSSITTTPTRGCRWGGEAIRDLVRNHDSTIMIPRQPSQQRAQLDEMRGSRSQRRRVLALGFLGAVVCSDAVDDDEANVVALKGDGQLVGEDVVLGFEVGGLDAEYFR